MFIINTLYTFVRLGKKKIHKQDFTESVERRSQDTRYVIGCDVDNW